ncbi:MAG TPA: phosphotransferase [Nevskiaceae bacterium]|nr:phosphotransferase [Nevskiaceae bacterium]
MSHRVHGLADDDTTPDWPPLEGADVTQLLAAFPSLHGAVTVDWLSPRPFSSAALVHTRAGEVFVKRYHRDVRSVARLEVEQRFAAHLRNRGIPTPPVLADAQGRTAVSRATWTYEVQAVAAGVDLYRDTPSWTPLTNLAHAHAAGEMLARLHAAAQGFSGAESDDALIARDTTLRAADPIAAIVSLCARRPSLGAYLAARNWRAELALLLAHQHKLQARLAALPRLWTHNDWHVSNLFWSGTGDSTRVSAVVDFGLAAQTFAWYDLATAVERNAIAWLHLERGSAAAFPATARALVAGYGRVRPLNDEDRALVAALLPIVHLDFALSEIDYYSGITHSAANADVAYRTFLLDHFAWFATRPGQYLLAAVRQP